MPTTSFRDASRTAEYTPDVELRLLPWAGPGNKPCYLSSGAEHGLLADLACRIEGDQLDQADELLGHVERLLNRDGAKPDELQLLVRPLAAALRDVARVAVSRGERLPADRVHGALSPEPTSRWALTPDLFAGTQYTGECLDCGQRSSVSSSPKRVQEWALEHAEETGDRHFKAHTFQAFTAFPVNRPSPPTDGR
uniref:DUF7848 domain-containing protein n=1 Tax=Streptomyces luteireticuli TaxID=173858 RepID=UPI003FD79C8F